MPQKFCVGWRRQAGGCRDRRQGTEDGRQRTEDGPTTGYPFEPPMNPARPSAGTKIGSRQDAKHATKSQPDSPVYIGDLPR
jgi:hypothetical protein